MAGIKIRAADTAFSKCVRESRAWRCQRCGTQHPWGSRGLECSHWIGRGNWAVRFDPDNCLSLCTACHFRVGGNPNEHNALYVAINGHGLADLVRERSQDIRLAREYRRTKGVGEIAAHYRAELARMQSLRADGITGLLEFSAWL